MCGVTMGHLSLRVTIGHLTVTIGHLIVTIGHPRVPIGHIRVTVGVLKMVHITLVRINAHNNNIAKECLLNYFIANIFIIYDKMKYFYLFSC